MMIFLNHTGYTAPFCRKSTTICLRQQKCRKGQVWEVFSLFVIGKICFQRTWVSPCKKADADCMELVPLCFIKELQMSWVMICLWAGALHCSIHHTSLPLPYRAFNIMVACALVLWLTLHNTEDHGAVPLPNLTKWPLAHAIGGAPSNPYCYG